jgi:hypothetical protein
MLKPEEEDFIKYWSENRLRRKKVISQLSLGLPLALVIIIATFINFFSGWYKRAVMLRNEEAQKHDGSLFLVLIIGALLIAIFITIFSVRHKWDQHEQKYRELLARRDRL